MVKLFMVILKYISLIIFISKELGCRVRNLRDLPCSGDGCLLEVSSGVEEGASVEGWSLCCR